MGSNDIGLTPGVISEPNMPVNLSRLPGNPESYPITQRRISSPYSEIADFRLYAKTASAQGEFTYAQNSNRQIVEIPSSRNISPIVELPSVRNTYQHLEIPSSRDVGIITEPQTAENTSTRYNLAA